MKGSFSRPAGREKAGMRVGETNQLAQLQNAINIIATKAINTPTRVIFIPYKDDLNSAFPLKRHHMVHFGAYAYPFAQLVVVVAGDVGDDGFAGF